MSSSLAERTGRYMAHARIEPSEPPTTPPAVNYSLPDDPDLALKEVADFWSPGVKDDELQDRLEAFANNLDTMTAAWAASLTRDYPAKLWPNLYGTICEALKAVADTPEPEVSDFSMWLVIEKRDESCTGDPTARYITRGELAVRYCFRL